LGTVEVERGELRPRVDDRTRHLFGYALALAAASLWGIAGTFAKAAFDRGVEPSELAEVRVGLGFLMFAALVAAFRRREARVRREHLPLLVVFGVIGVFGIQLTFYEAIKRLPLALAVLIQYLAPLLMLAWMWARGRTVGNRLWTAALLTVVGCYFAVGAYDANLLRLNLEGTLIALLAAAIFAFYLLVAERIVRAYSAWTLLLYGFGVAALAWTALRPWWTLPFGSWDATTYLLILGIAIVGTLLPFFLSATALSLLPATRVGLTETAEPVVAGIAAFLVLGEALAGPQLVGAALVLGGILLARSVQPGVDGV
jgi:drug/metabolite transporter (DMT)-like permease